MPSKAVWPCILCGGPGTWRSSGRCGGGDQDSRPHASLSGPRHLPGGLTSSASSSWASDSRAEPQGHWQPVVGALGIFQGSESECSAAGQEPHFGASACLVGVLSRGFLLPSQCDPLRVPAARKGGWEEGAVVSLSTSLLGRRPHLGPLLGDRSPHQVSVVSTSLQGLTQEASCAA